MREIIKVMLQEGIDEETIHEVLNVLEDWNGKTGVPSLDNSQEREKNEIGHKRVMVSPERALRTHANMYRRRGIPVTPKQFEQSRRNDGTKGLEQRLQKPGPTMNEPFIVYNQGSYNKDFGTRREAQDGAHRTVAAMNLGHDKVPLNIFYKKKNYTNPTDHAVDRHNRKITKERLEKQASNKRKSNLEKLQQDNS